MLRSASSMVGGYWLSLLNTGPTSGQTAHVCYAVVFPLPRKAETMSQPVKAWKKSMPLHFSWPRFIAKSWIGNHLMDCPWPNSNQSISKPTFWRLAKTSSAMTRMSVSHALINRDFVFCLAAWTACVKILESASSWLQGCRPSKLMDLFDKTFSPLVTTTTFQDTWIQSCLLDTQTVLSYCHCLSENWTR